MVKLGQTGFIVKKKENTESVGRRTGTGRHGADVGLIGYGAGRSLGVGRLRRCRRRWRRLVRVGSFGRMGLGGS